INNVVDVSTIDAGKFEVVRKSVDLVPLVARCCEAMQAPADEREITLEWTSSSEQMIIQGDADKLGEALTHLLRNAISYNRAQGHVHVTLGRLQHDVRIWVRDSGVGIDPDEQEVIFERMSRGRSAEAGETDARGMGLGLYLTQVIVREHGGNIRVEDSSMWGTTIEMCLPVDDEISVIHD
ncbi:MAG: sensor histidine kinase, partial [Anaerolineales bacterium]